MTQRSSLHHIFWSLCPCLLVLDLGVKYFIQGHLQLFDPYPIFSLFDWVKFYITYATNTGAAWGFFQSYGNILFLFRLLAIGCLGYYLFFRLRKKHTKTTLPLLLIFTGAIGNLLDTLIYGHVIDMFHFVFFNWHYPIFNLADSYIFIGICWLILLPKEEANETADTST